MEIKKEKRGGRREGSGRKKGVDTKMISLKLEQELYDALESIDNRNKYINDAVRFALKEKEAFREFLTNQRRG